jgi:hypothetical protein
MKRQNSSPKTSSVDGVTSTTNSVGDDDGFKRQRQNTSSESGDIVQEQIEAFQQDAEEIKALLQGQQQQQQQHQASGTEGVNQDDAPLEQQGMGQNGSYLLAPGLIGNRALGNLEPNIDGDAAGAQNNIFANGDNGRDRPHVILQDGRQGRDLPQSQTNGTVTAINNQNLRERGNGPGHGNSSDDDGEADGDNIWLAPRQRRQPRVGNNFQATLPSPK